MRQAERQAGSTLALALGLTAVAVLAPFAAHASAPAVPTVIQGLLCQMVEVASGTTGKAMASVAIIAMGIAALFGKISWNLAAIVLVGIALIFGSGSMIGSLGGSNTCSNSTGPSFSFSCSAGTATGNMFQADVMTNYSTATGTDAETIDKSNCNPGGTGTNPGIFATILCFFKAVVGQILSSMYCQFQSVMVGPISIAMTLFTMLFGFMIMTGITNFTAKEATLFLLKMAIVWTFALNPAWGIGVGYRFFMGIAEEGSALVTQGSTAQLTDPDSMLGSLLGFISGNGAGNLTNSTYTGMSQWCTLYATLAVVALLLFMPMVSMFLVMLLLQYLGLYFRAALGYLTALVLISFLFVLAPLFIGFALFKTTFPLFEQWVKYLISFSVQMIIVFGFLTMIQIVPVSTYFNELLGLLKQYDVTGGKGNLAMPSHVCSICEYTITPGGNGTPDSIACNTNAATPTDGDDVQAAAPDTGYVIPLSALSHHMDFFRFTISQTLAFYLIFWVIQDFLKRVPEFARSIGGLQMSPALTGDDFAGLANSLEDQWSNFVNNHQGMARGMLAGGALTAGAMALLRNGNARASSGSGSSGSGATLPRTAVGTGATSPAASNTGPSGPAGTGKMNVDAAVRQIDNTPGTYGRCAHSVRLALEAGGVNTTGHGEYAREYDPLLVREGFRDVSGSNYVPQKGDVVVIHATDGGGAGHIAMYDGHQWVSDHRQRTMLDGLHVTSYKIYRANGTGGTGTQTAGGSTQGQTLAQAYAAGGKSSGSGSSAKSSGSTGGGNATTSAPGQGINSSNKAEKMAAETRHLMDKFGLTEQQAAAITGNLVGESNMVGNSQELHPLAGRGGLGWAQWTGPRRVQFEAFMRANPHLTPDEASQQFLDHELSTTYRGTISALKQTNNVHDATHSFLVTFERPAKDNTSTRERYAEQALAATDGKPIAAETAIASVNYPQGGGGESGGTGGSGGYAGGGIGGMLALAGSSGSDGGAGAEYMPVSVSTTQIVDQGGFRINAVNSWQSSQSSWSSMNPETDDTKAKADAEAKAAADKKAADEAAAVAAATSSTPVTQQVAQLQQDTYNQVKSLELELSASRSYLPEAMVTQTENTIRAALSTLTTDNTEEGLARALEQITAAQNALKLTF